MDLFATKGSRTEMGVPLLVAFLGSSTPKENRRRFFSPPTAESFGVSAQVGSGVVRGGGEVRFHEGSTEVV